jgi:pimeloyl-ACP methyl ester carboxylesterase
LHASAMVVLRPVDSVEIAVALKRCFCHAPSRCSTLNRGSCAKFRPYNGAHIAVSKLQHCVEAAPGSLSTERRHRDAAMPACIPPCFASASITNATISSEFEAILQCSLSKHRALRQPRLGRREVTTQVSSACVFCLVMIRGPLEAIGIILGIHDADARRSRRQCDSNARTMNMPFERIDGQSLHYIDEGHGFPILLGHSFLWNSAAWKPQMKLLSQKYRVIAPDLWGHGKSGPMPMETRELSDLARHAIALLDALGIETCALVGHSIGGMWGAELALREPGRVKCLVLMNTYLGPEPETPRQQYLAMMDQVEASGTVLPQLLDAIVPVYFRPGMDASAPICTTFRTDLANISPEALRQSVIPIGRMVFNRADMRPRLPGLDRESTLLLCGAHDIPRPPTETQEMTQIIGCRYISVPTSGHMSGLENPDFVTQTLLSEFDRRLCQE